MKPFLGFGDIVFLSLLDIVETRTPVFYYQIHQKLALPLSEEGVLHYTHLFSEVDELNSP